MTRYEVNLEVDVEVAGAFVEWLACHVADMLALPGFLGAEAFEVELPPGARRAYCVVYRLADRAALQRYLIEQAPRMRAEGMRRFGGRFSATRRVLAELPFSAPAPAP